MGLSRREFTKEFKIAALRQLDAGVSIAAVARWCEIIRICCIAGGGIFSTHQNMRSLA
jgi:hypothetical protein